MSSTTAHAVVFEEGASLLDTFRATNARAAFNVWAGFEVARMAPGEAELHLAWREEFGQYSGFLHAGMIGALLDTACGFAAATKHGSVLAAHFSMNCLSPAVGERFVATGRLIKGGRRQAFARAELAAVSGGTSKLVATGETVLAVVEA